MKIYLLIDERYHGSRSIIDAFTDEIDAKIARIIHQEWENSIGNTKSYGVFKIIQLDVKGVIQSESISENN